MKEYYTLTKPGIVYSHAMTAVAGLLFAAHLTGTGITALLVIGTLVGVVLIVASYCVFNNILDRRIDALMERTKSRAIPTEAISIPHALAFGLALFIAGASIFLYATNLLALLVQLFGMFAYLALYTPAKTRTVHSTLIGTLSGGAPLVAGYVTVTGVLDLTALILFLIMLAWQMVHFFSIGLYRRSDYEAAAVPIFPVRYGSIPTKALMLTYALIFALANYALFAVGASAVYLWVMETLSAIWIAFTLYGFWATDDVRWGKRLFFYSLFVVVAFSLALALA
jgi:protoheme IX farnesyltransferase